MLGGGPYSDGNQAQGLTSESMGTSPWSHRPSLAWSLESLSPVSFHQLVNAISLPVGQSRDVRVQSLGDT